MPAAPSSCQSAAATPAGTFLGSGAVFAAMGAQYVGASIAKQLFPVVGAAGMTALRVTLAAGLLVVLRRAWWHWPATGQWGVVLRYGAMLGMMNLLIYQAFARIPIGLAVAIEVLGPLAVTLAGVRRRADLLWLALAMAGLALLLPWPARAQALDPLGVAFAFGAAAAWAAYIVFGKRAAAMPGVDAVAWGMAVAAVGIAPLGLWDAGARLFSAQALGLGLGVAALSSALPYALEMFALRRLPARAFGLLSSSAPAIAALAGVALLGERLSVPQWCAIGLIVAAVAGSTVATARARKAI